MRQVVALGEYLERPAFERLTCSPGIRLAEGLLRIRDRNGSNLPLRANRAQIEFERRRRRRNIVLKSRQMGISTWVAGRLFLRTILIPGTVSMQVAHTQEAAEAIFGMVHRFLEYLPETERDGPWRTSVLNRRQIVFPELDSEYRVETAGDPNAGRGLTLSNLHCSEVARWPGNPQETLQGLLAALAPNGELYLESTPMGAAGCFWQQWQQAPETDMVRHFFPWWWEAAYVARAVEETSLTEEERRLMERHALTLEQIGYRRKIHRMFGPLAMQEYPEDENECFLTSGDCYFEISVVDARLRALPDPIAARDNGRLLVWYPPVPGRGYLLAVDPAGGGPAGDFTAMQVIDQGSGLQCAELKGRISMRETALVAARLAVEYNNALVAVERNNQGAGVIAYLRETERYSNLYAQDGQAGWLTTSVSRPGMLGELAAALVEKPEIFMSARLLGECRTFVRRQGGRPEAQAGEHDDCVMAMALALAVRSEGGAGLEGRWR